MTFYRNEFMTGFIGGTILIYISVSQDLMWGSLAMGLLIGLLNEGYHKPIKSNRRKKK